MLPLPPQHRLSVLSAGLLLDNVSVNKGMKRMTCKANNAADPDFIMADNPQALVPHQLMPCGHWESVHICAHRCEVFLPFFNEDRCRE